MKQRVARWASGEDQLPLTHRIVAQQPQSMGGPGGVAINYSVTSNQVRVFKSKDHLRDFLTELERIGGTPVYIHAEDQYAPMKSVDQAIEWLTGSTRSFKDFSVSSGNFSLSTSYEVFGERGQAYQVSGTLLITDVSNEIAFEFHRLVETFEHATRPATARERKMKRIPYTPLHNRDTEQQHDNKGKGWKNAGAGVLIAVVAGLIVTVVSKIFT